MICAAQLTGLHHELDLLCETACIVVRIIGESENEYLFYEEKRNALSETEPIHNFHFCIFVLKEMFFRVFVSDFRKYV